jgi:hypothetical protein
MLLPRNRSDAPVLSLRMQAAQHLYRLGYRITSDGRLSRPKHSVERIYGTDQEGPGTTVFFVCADGRPVEVRMSYATLAVLSFYGPDILRPHLRIRFKDGNKSNLKKGNVFVDERAEVAREAKLTWTAQRRLTKRMRTAEKKQRIAFAQEVAHIKATSPQLFDKARCRVLAYAVGAKMTTIEQAAAKLGVSVAVATSMLLIGRDALARERAREQERVQARGRSA